jgi:co-chaperonin GroES (HSP10)
MRLFKVQLTGEDMSEKTFIPVNRHLLIELVETREERPDHGILLPEDYAPKQSEHAVIKILDWAEDVKIQPIEVGLGAIVDRSMIKELKYQDQTIHLILENYVTCLVVEE